MPRMFTGAADRAWPGCSRPRAGLPKASVPAIGRIAEKGPDPASAPRLLAAARRIVLPLQAAADLAETETVAANPSEDLADHLCFLLNDFVAGNTTTVMLADIAIAIRCCTKHVHR